MKKILLLIFIACTMLVSCTESESEPNKIDSVTFSDMIGYNLLGIDDEVIGIVEHMILDDQNDRLRYVVVALPFSAYEGKAGLIDEDELIPVPWSRITLNGDEQILNSSLTLENLIEAPHLAEIPATLSPGWDKEIAAFWQERQ